MFYLLPFSSEMEARDRNGTERQTDAWGSEDSELCLDSNWLHLLLSFSGIKWRWRELFLDKVVRKSILTFLDL